MGRSKPLRPGAQARSAAIQKFASSPSSSTNGLSNTTSLPAPPPAEPHLDVAETLVEVERLSEECEPEKARELCRRLVKQPDGEKDPKVWEALAVVELDLEEVTKAKKHFLKAIQLGAPTPSPSAHLYLAQFASTAPEALEHFSAALGLLRARLEKLVLERGGKSVAFADGEEPGEHEWEKEERENRRSCSRALVGMTECYLTDLCFDNDAETKCIEYLAQAAALDPTDPEPLQTLASVRLSQQNPDAAKEALRLSWGLWKHVSPFEDEADGTGDDQVLDEAKMVDGDAANDEEEEDDDDDDDDGLPPFETRIGWAKLAMECEMLPEAIEVLQGCEAQDDEDEECLYLLGVAWELMGEANGKEKAEGSGNGEVEMEQEGKRSMIGQGLEKEECWIEAREYLDSCLKLHERSLEVDPSGSASALDEEVVAHINELVGKLSERGVGPAAALEAQDGEDGEDGEWSDMEE